MNFPDSVKVILSLDKEAKALKHLRVRRGPILEILSLRKDIRLQILQSRIN